MKVKFSAISALPAGIDGLIVKSISPGYSFIPLFKNLSKKFIAKKINSPFSNSANRSKTKGASPDSVMSRETITTTKKQAQKPSI